MTPECLRKEREVDRTHSITPHTGKKLDRMIMVVLALALGVTYQVVCCHAGPHHIRAMAEALGKNPPASRYSADMSKHYAFGTDAKLVKENLEFADKM
jgi:betaine-homocysteine S-methyltransferase